MAGIEPIARKIMDNTTDPQTPPAQESPQSSAPAEENKVEANEIVPPPTEASAISSDAGVPPIDAPVEKNNDISQITPTETPSVPNSSTTEPISAAPEIPPLAPTLPAEPVQAPAMDAQNAPKRDSRSFLAKALEKIQFRKRAKLEKIVKLAGEKHSITNDQVEKLLRVSDATATRYLTDLMRQGRLRQVGARGGARYEPLIGSNGGN